MRAIKIDAENHTFEVISLGDNHLKAMQDAVGGSIERAYSFPNGDEAYCDEEGLLKGPTAFVVVEGAHQPFAGNLVIVGKPDIDGNTTCALSSLVYLNNNINFIGVNEVHYRHYWT